MKPSRLSIAGLMGVVLYFAMAFAALRYPSELVASSLFTLTVILLLMATLGLSPKRNAGWRGFVLFGWAYLIIWYASEASMTTPPKFFTAYLVEEARISLYGSTSSSEDPPGLRDSGYFSSYASYSYLDKQYHSLYYRLRFIDQICHLLILPVFGLIGTISCLYLGARRDRARKFGQRIPPQARREA